MSPRSCAGAFCIAVLVLAPALARLCDLACAGKELAGRDFASAQSGGPASDCPLHSHSAGAASPDRGAPESAPCHDRKTQSEQLIKDAGPASTDSRAVILAGSADFPPNILVARAANIPRTSSLPSAGGDTYPVLRI